MYGNRQLLSNWLLTIMQEDYCSINLLCIRYVWLHTGYYYCAYLTLFYPLILLILLKEQHGQVHSAQ